MNRVSELESAAEGKKFLQGRKVLREYIKEYLVEMILRGEFGAGERIIETRLAQNLGVSQGAVREALRELEWMGFLQTVPFGGTKVKALTLADFQEIYPVRAVLEALGARLAVVNLSEADLQELRALVDEMIHYSELGDEHGMVERNYAFHQKIIQASGNSTLIRVWSMFQFSYWTAVSTFKLHNDLLRLAQRHSRILEVLKTRDPDAADLVMREHIMGLLDNLTERQAGEAAADPNP